jgi:DNA-binding XRE family transcriptional regulator
MEFDRNKLKSAVRHEVMLKQFLEEDPEFRAEYERLGPRFELISAIIGARIKKGWTQTDLAKACGSSQSAIARLESGEHDPKWSTAVHALRALGLDIAIAGTPPAESA